MVNVAVCVVLCVCRFLVVLVLRDFPNFIVCDLALLEREGGGVGGELLLRVGGVGHGLVS